MASVGALKLDLGQFYLSIRKFLGDSRAHAPFKFEGGYSTAFDVIDPFTSKRDQLEVQIEKFRELEDLFELQPTIYPEIGESRSKIKQLILLWKFKGSVGSVHTGWEKEFWHVVNAVDLEDQNKRLRKQLKEMGSANPAMKGWQVYRDIDDSMAVMATGLPLVNDLHTDARRACHWAALAQEIEGIIETALKELKIEKKLTKIEGLG